MRKYLFPIQMLVAALLMALLAGCAGHNGTQARTFQLDPAQVPNPYHTLVDIEFVKPLVFEAMLRTDPSPDFMIIDSRPKQPRFDVGHIPTAVSLPDSQFERMAAEVLPADRNALLVFYCGGLHCPLSHQSAWKAEAMGYTNIAVYPAGDPEWVEQGYKVWTARDVRSPLPTLDPAQVPNPFHTLVTLEEVRPFVSRGVLLANPPTDVMIIDSRPKQPRYDVGHIPTAVSLPDSQFERMAAEVLPADKNTKLIFYCGGTHCPLSHQSAWKAEAMGYTNVAVYPAGDPEWVERGYIVWTADGARQAQDPAPTPAKAAAPAGALKPGSAEGTVDNDFFVQLMRDNPASIQLIDVRSPAEFSAGHIPGARNMTVDMLEDNIKSFSTAEKPIVFICSTGARSGEAFYLFMEMRPDLQEVYYVDANVSYTPTGEFAIN
ncbi:3-mercaptopyruvate sulfurtransferase SseA, contains two rhodanese domains [Desulfonatronum thiosulfatophilum]|uniref:3-mercaptopyruvate sulfurtransferase SseA, contains two rhodanese domains n=1 Tax=Desulfonatronum thiosulfatophilum TaxID=617002 RepID=A0A1G6AMQ2_9BACT|nr:rhodanese-like domain-containing protein [Desulfonatronum thiosulfatophilum]SDB09645.1 3-mercaptopyruvate sulfurtransferase SseA, contains two rhodanese domains [Desulfonatronum thiosulfatophilum]